MLIFLKFFGESAPMQVPEDISFGEFKQLLQLQTGVPVRDQRLSGLPQGVTDETMVGAALTDGETVTMQAVDIDEEHRQAQSMVAAEDEAEDLMRLQNEHMQQAPPATASFNPFAYFSQGSQQSTSIPQALRAMQQSASAASHASTPASTATSHQPIIIDDEPAGRDAKRHKVDPELGESLSSIVWGQLNAQPTISSVLGDVRRHRRPLLCLVHNVHQLESVDLLGTLSQKLEDPDTRALFSRFEVWMSDVKTAAFDNFIELVENNQDLHQQLQDHWAGATLPFVCIIIPAQGATLQVYKLLSGQTGVTFDAILAALLQVIAEHSERLETERSVNQAVTGDRMIMEEQDMALNEAMEADRRLEEERQKKEAEEAAAQRAEEEKVRAEEKAQGEARARVEARRGERAAKLPQEPEPGEGVVRLMFRLPNGDRLERRFHVSAALETAYWLFDTTPEIASQFDDTDSCRLVLNYPRKSFSLAEHGSLTCEALGLTDKTALFVQSE